jgi:hypothetical protein
MAAATREAQALAAARWHAPRIKILPNATPGRRFRPLFNDKKRQWPVFCKRFSAAGRIPAFLDKGLAVPP